MGSDSSDHDEDQVDFQAQVSTMINPLVKKHKKTENRVKVLVIVARLAPPTLP